MTPLVSSEARIAATTLLLANGKRVRMRMRGRSMYPTVRAGMVLEVEARGVDTRPGDILVYRDARRLVAHRLLRFGDRCCYTAGDAQPHVVEAIADERIVGRVRAVWSSDASRRRVDGRAFRLYGWCLAHAQPLRAGVARALIASRRVFRACRFRSRTRGFAALCGMLESIVCGDRARFDVLLHSTDADALLAAASRHRCGGVLHAAIGEFTFEGDIGANQAERALAPLVWGTAVYNARIRTQLDDVVRTLTFAQVPFMLLKGAARLFRGGEQTTHPSSDLDLMVPRERLDDAVLALRAHGYRHHVGNRRVQNYRVSHHHAAPLVCEGGCPVELHVALAPPGWLTLRTDWEALRSHRVAYGEGARVTQLDDVGTALHLAIHSAAAMHLRDLFLAAQILRRSDAPTRTRLREWAATERCESLRLRAALAFAADLARVEWPRSPYVSLYLEWLRRREDLPVLLARRTCSVDALFIALSGRPIHAVRVLLRCTSLRRLRVVPQVVGRIACGVVALAYVSLMNAPASPVGDARP